VALEETPTGNSTQATLSDIVIALHGLWVATSGDYRRFVDHGERRYAHTIDPESGRPLANSTVTVTVLHKSCMWADALATAMMVMGSDAAVGFARSHRIAARIVQRAPYGFSEILTPGFEALIEA
jgi:thiamine biosynthesis lipoprotein